MSKTTVTSSGSEVRASTAWTWRVSGRARGERSVIWNRNWPCARTSGEGSTSPSVMPGGQIFRQPQVQGLQGELGAALVVRAGR